MNEKNYHIRAYIEGELEGQVMNSLIYQGGADLIQTIDGDGEELLCIYDLRCDRETLEGITAYGIRILPFNNFGDFLITCPSCGERIDDDMFLTAYTEEVLRGYNIRCDRQDCGIQRAVVQLL